MEKILQKMLEKLKEFGYTKGSGFIDKKKKIVFVSSREMLNYHSLMSIGYINGEFIYHFVDWM